MNSIEEQGEGAEKKALRQVDRYEKESRYLVKRSEDFQVIEEVFDKPTRLTLYDLMNAGYIRHLNGVVSAGKESRVYWGVTSKGEDVAVKIYLTTSVEFKKRMIYISGDPRFKAIKGWSHRVVEVWAQKEFKNLRTAYENGISVPKPIAVKKNILLMEFIGKNGRPLPLLAESSATKSDYKRIISMIKKLYQKANLVHADMSEFNIFKGDGKLVIFDMGSSVDIRHPLNQQFLIRDLTNVNHFFSKNRVEVVPLDQLAKEIVGDEFSSNNTRII